jgi:hypothetical protein
LKFDFKHFLCCEFLGDDVRPALVAEAAREDWKSLTALIISRFRAFIHLFRHGQCDIDEEELFERIDFPADATD